MHNERLTGKSSSVGKEEIWYFVNVALSQKNREILAKIQDKIRDEFGDAIRCVPKNNLHVTLMDWISPFGTYKKDKKEIFAEIYDSFDDATGKVLAGYDRIELHFKELKITSDAVIAIFEDDGSFQKIRKDIMRKVRWVEGNKLPPDIIHSTLVRFVKEIPLERIEKIVNANKPFFDEAIHEFQLGKGLKTGIMEHEVIKKYPLGIE